MEVVANNGGTTRIGGVTGKGFVPGRSGNPAGRPRGIAKAVREKCGGDPELLVDILLGIAQDETQRAADRTNAARALIEHGWGKAPAFAAIEGTDPLERDEITEKIAELVAELRETRAA